jgi:WD40 repeat protein
MKNKALPAAIVVTALSLACLGVDNSAQSSKEAVPDLRQSLHLIQAVETSVYKYGHVYFDKESARIIIRGSNWVRIFNVPSIDLETTITPCSGGKFSTGMFDGFKKLIAVGCFEGGIAEVWDVPSSRRIRQFRIGNANGPSITTQMSPDESTLVLYNAHGGPVELWHIETERKIATLMPLLSEGVLDADAVEFSPDSRIVAVSYNRYIYLWNVFTGEMLSRLVDDSDNLRYSWDGKAAHRNFIYRLLFTADSKYLLSGSVDTEVKLWSTATGKLVRTFKGHRDRIFALALSPDGKTLATGSRDEKVKLWDMETGRCLWTSPSHKSYVWKIFFSPDGKRFLTMTDGGNIGDKNEIRMWETATGRLLGKMPGIWWQSFFSQDWKYFVTRGKKEGTIELYEFVE